jgi:gluconolactonase
MRLFTDMMLDGNKCGPDGMRADVFGNLWISFNAPLGYAGVLCFTKEGKLIGRIRLPEVCANLAFGGPKRDRLSWPRAHRSSSTRRRRRAPRRGED